MSLLLCLAQFKHSKIPAGEIKLKFKVTIFQIEFKFVDVYVDVVYFELKSFYVLRIHQYHRVTAITKGFAASLGCCNWFDFHSAAAMFLCSIMSR